MTPIRSLLLLLLLVQACKPSTTTNPKAPKAAYSVTKMEVQNDKFLSTVNIPVSIALADVERQINSQVNGLIYEDNSLIDNDNDQFMIKVWKQAPIRVTAQDSLFYFQVPLKIWAKAGLKVLGFTQFQETDFELVIKFATRFSVERDWTAHTQTTAQGYDWVRKPALKIAGLEIPVTGIVGRLIDKNLGKVTKALDEQVQKQIDLRTPVLKAWNLIRQPYLISDKYRTWLLVVPKRILITPFQFERGAIRSTIGIEGYTLTQTGIKPDVKPASTIPELVVSKDIPHQFRIGLLSEATYAEAAKLVSQEFVGQLYEFRDGRYKITITGIDLYGQNNNLIIKADLRGSINGAIYLRGQPFYDAQTRTISLRDLHYDLDTKNILYKTASWLLQGSFARTLEKQLTIPVGNQIDEARASLQNKLTNNQVAKGVVINGKLEQVSPDQVYLTSESMLAVVYATGKIDLKVEGL
ncbi:DUF4403 family protein [Larkinella sp. VNQ87]|uniref:DUF4403 family protein n=1 Tax=Larkinella sp. VNQ87 TaxID=3400921 RepID=UPI003C109912